MLTYDPAVGFGAPFGIAGMPIALGKPLLLYLLTILQSGKPTRTRSGTNISTIGALEIGWKGKILRESTIREAVDVVYIYIPCQPLTVVSDPCSSSWYHIRDMLLCCASKQLVNVSL